MLPGLRHTLPAHLSQAPRAVPESAPETSTLTDFIHDGEAVNRPNNAQEIYLERLGQESPMLVKLIMKSIYKQNRREIKHIGSKRFGVQFILHGFINFFIPCFQFFNPCFHFLQLVFPFSLQSLFLFLR